MAKPEWGLKRTCLSCGARFYDMQRDPIVCPTCETEFDPLALVRPRRARAAASQAKAKAEGNKKPAKKTSEESGDDLIVDDGIDMDDDDIDLIEDDEDEKIEDDHDVSEALGNAKEENPD